MLSSFTRLSGKKFSEMGGKRGQVGNQWNRKGRKGLKKKRE